MDATRKLGKALEELATDEFGALSETEIHLLACLHSGETFVPLQAAVPLGNTESLTERAANSAEFLDVRNGPRPEEQAPAAAPAHAPEHGPAPLPQGDAVIGASLIRWLCTSKGAAPLIHARGLNIEGVVIRGALDLAFVACPFPVILVKCTLADRVDLSYAKFPLLKLLGCTVEELRAPRVSVATSIMLNDSSFAQKISLEGCDVGAHLRLKNAKLHGRGESLNLEGARIAGMLWLAGTFHAVSPVRIYGCEIKKNIECYGTVCAPRGKVALLIENSQIGGSILLRRGFRAVGQVRIFNVTVNGFVDLQGSRLSAVRMHAVRIEQAKISGSVFLRATHPSMGTEPFRCIGGVVLGHCIVNGDLDFTETRIQAGRRSAIDLRSVRIDGHCYANDARVRGRAVFVRLIVKHDIVFSGAHLDYSRGFAVRAPALNCGGTLWFVKARLKGGLNLNGASIGDDVRGSHLEVDVGTGRAIELVSARIRGSFELADARCSGPLMSSDAEIGAHFDLRRATLSGLDMRSAKIGSDLVLSGATVRAPAGTNEAIRLIHLRCGGFILMGEGFRCDSKVDLTWATVGASVFAERANFENRRGPAIDAHMIRVSGHFILRSSQVVGRVLLGRVSIGGMADFSESRFVSQDNVALSMVEASVGGALRMTSLTCFGEIRLPRTKIGDAVLLSGSRLYGSRSTAIDLRGCHVASDVRFDNFGGAHSRTTRIRGGVDIQGATVAGSLMFSSIVLVNRDRATLNAGRAQIAGMLVFHRTFRTNGKINLTQASVGTLHDDRDDGPIARGLWLEGFTYRNLSPLSMTSRLEWLKIWRPGTDFFASEHEMSWQPYEQLAACFKSHGREADAREISIHKQRAIAGEKRNFLVRWVYFLYDFTMRYGYRPQRALIFAPFLIGIATAVFVLGGHELMVPADKFAREQWIDKHSVPAGYPSLNALAYSVDTFVPILSLQQRDTWRPDDRAECSDGPKNCGQLLRIYLWVHTVFGWVITTLAVAGFTGLIRKD